MNNRQAIKVSIRNIRQSRIDKSVSCIMGMGWTVATRDGRSQIRKIDNDSYNFSGSWNKDSVYWTREHAEKVLQRVSENDPVLGSNLCVMHKNDLRDAQCKGSMEVVNMLFPIRNRF